MKKRTIGQVLRLSRVNLHLSLQDVSNKTAIEIPYIEALENDDERFCQEGAESFFAAEAEDENAAADLLSRKPAATLY